MDEAFVFAAPGLPERIFRTSTGRLIAGARCFTATIALFAIWLDRTPPAYPALAYGLVLLYLLYAAAFLALAGRLARTAADGVVAHAIDMAAILAIVFFTTGATSSFFAYFHFLLLAGYLRWGWRAALATALLLLVGYAGISYAAGMSYDSGNLDDFLVRFAYLGIAAAVITFVGRGHEQMRARLTELANWPAVGEESNAVGDVLSHAARCLGCTRVAFVWIERGGGRAWVHLWDGSRAHTRRKPRHWAKFILPAERSGQAIHRLGSAPALLALPWRRRAAEDAPYARKLLRLFRARSILAMQVGTEAGRGWVLALDGRFAPGTGHKSVARLIASRIDALMQDLDLRRRMRDAAARERMAELARDLHDGILQTLAGASMHLQDMRRLIASNPERAAGKVEMLLELVAQEQRELRNIIGEMQPERAREPGRRIQLQPQIEQLVAHLEKQWQMEIAYELRPAQAEIPLRLNNQLRRIVAEAVANAKRHSRATRAWLTIEVGRDNIALSVSNDRPKGAGDALPAEVVSLDGARPKTLSRRVSALGGTSAIHASEDRVEVTVQVPQRA